MDWVCGEQDDNGVIDLGGSNGRPGDGQIKSSLGGFSPMLPRDLNDFGLTWTISVPSTPRRPRRLIIIHHHHPLSTSSYIVILYDAQLQLSSLYHTPPRPRLACVQLDGSRRPSTSTSTSTSYNKRKDKHVDSPSHLFLPLLTDRPIRRHTKRSCLVLLNKLSTRLILRPPAPLLPTADLINAHRSCPSTPSTSPNSKPV
jgi:hypothetical protein